MKIITKEISCGKDKTRIVKHECQDPCLDYIYGGCGFCPSYCHQQESSLDELDKIIIQYRKDQKVEPLTERKVSMKIRMCDSCKNETTHEVREGRGIVTRYRTITGLVYRCLTCNTTTIEEKEVVNENVQIWD